MRGTYFRAWDIEAKCYVQGPILVDNFGQVYVVCEEASKEEGTCLITGKPNVIIEQDTGLKDKNGKEICEGDIVKTCSIGTWAVEGRRGCFFVGKYALYGHNDYGEVIGNIHENPELLEHKG